MDASFFGRTRFLRTIRGCIIFWQNKVYQDNKSMILLAESRRASSSKRTRHLNVWYYFVTDQIEKGYVKVAFCPMADMLADFFKKPLQGALFVCMQDQILNPPASKHNNVHRSVLGEDKICDERWEHTSHGKGGKKWESAWNSPRAPTRVSTRMEKRLQCARGSARVRGKNYHQVALAHNFSIY